MEAWCVRCKAHRKMTGEKEISMKGGRRAMSGKCEKCNTKMMRFLPKK